MSRDHVYQQPPNRRLDDFPTSTIDSSTPLYRVHKNGNGPWWFGSSMDGRFDLPTPRGTCYLGLTASAAVWEMVGPELADIGFVSAEFTDVRRVSTLTVPHTQTVADTTADAAANHGVTRELCTMTPYAVPQQWAAAFDEIADGVRYQTRFSTGPAAQAVAIFGDAGEAGWPTARPADIVSLTVAAGACGIAAIAPPSKVTIVAPPD